MSKDKIEKRIQKINIEEKNRVNLNSLDNLRYEIFLKNIFLKKITKIKVQ
jgi:hypothetical protein